MFHDHEGPPVEGNVVEWIGWYRRITGVDAKEATKEWRLQIRIRVARAVQYHARESRVEHDPTKALIVAGENWPVVGQIYNELYQRLKA